MTFLGHKTPTRNVGRIRWGITYELGQRPVYFTHGVTDLEVYDWWCYDGIKIIILSRFTDTSTGELSSARLRGNDAVAGHSVKGVDRKRSQGCGLVAS